MKQILTKCTLFVTLYVFALLPVFLQRVLASSNEIQVHSTYGYTTTASDESTSTQPSDQNGQEMPSSQPIPDLKDEDGDDVIIVATLDGTFYGLSRITGERIWKSPKQEISQSETDVQTHTSKHTQTTPKMPRHPTKAPNNSKGDDTNNNQNSIFSPLVSTTTTRTNNKTWRTAAVPSIDGRVYLTLGKSVKDTVTSSIKELVERSPFMDAKGRFFVSNRKAYAVAMSKETGEILRAIKAGDDSRDSLEEQLNFNPDGPIAEDFIWVARVDYEVTVKDARTGEVDVQFSASEVLSMDDMIHGSISEDEDEVEINVSGMSNMLMLPSIDKGREDKIRASTGPFPNPEGGPSSSDRTFSDLYRESIEEFENGGLLDYNAEVVSTPGGKMAFRNPESGSIQWISNETFDSPVAFAVESSTGASLGVQIVPDAPVVFSEEYLETELERQLNIELNFIEDGSGSKAIDAFDDETVFGALDNGELFAMPIGRRSNIGSKQSRRYHRNGMNGLPHQIPRISSTVGGTAKHLPLPAKIPIPSKTGMHAINAIEKGKEIDTIVDASRTGSGKLMLSAGNGVGGISGTTTSGSSTALASILRAQKCDQNSPNYSTCLIGIYMELMGTVDNIADKQEIEKMLLDLPENVANYQNPKPNNIFWDILTSWLPPAVAMAFVLSFEIGRRERARVEELKKRDDFMKEKTFQEHSTGSISFQRELSEENMNASLHHEEEEKEKSGGVIHVSEQVLGYGGHGTVVYKGKLDGRFVAVKRMLKAYHASADREISLLIESDGHPNVVRYFLKECRGDFVYLALELCDMNLQDLIVSLSKHRMKIAMQQRDSDKVPTICTEVDSPVRKILLAIANGVKHIHSLRIVHRDLKPANILVAKKTRRSKKESKIDIQKEDVDDVYQTFEAELYVPKISDMGLGKQLAGQSSFGMSTFNTSLGPGMSGNDGSTIAGAGPGSVGWQAPEVMARRLSPESASVDGSGPESYLLEASPMDYSLSGKTSRSVDIFSLGCIFYCTLLPGSHPFGEWYEREANIMKNRPTTDALKDVSYDAWDLVCSMLNRNPKLRPTAAQICRHPFFWDATERLAFLCEFSDRLESDAESNSGARGFDRLLIEKQASSVVGLSWDSNIDPILLNNVQKFRTYDTSSVRDCLRLIRNKHHHFDEMPLEFRENVPDQCALLKYFEDNFPRLLMHCYTTCREHFQRDDPLTIKFDIPCNTAVLLKKKEFMDKNRSSSIVSSITIETTEEHTIHNGEEKVHLAMKAEESSNNIGSNHQAIHSIGENADATIGVPATNKRTADSLSQEIIAWQGSTAAETLSCRGWIRSADDWVNRANEKSRKRDPNLVRCAEDPKFRTRLCNHWDVSQGTKCPMLKKNKCVFAHGPVELRVKEGKRNRWGRLVDANGNNSNPQHSGGEDTFGAARSIESARKVEGKWNTGSTPKKRNQSKNKKTPKKN